MTQPLLVVDDLWVEVTPRGSREPVPVVRGASFSLHEGSITCLVGESGSGKTLLMRSILGISRAGPGVTRGRAELSSPGAQCFTTASPERRSARAGALPWAGQVAYVFQHPLQALDPFQSVLQHLKDSVRVSHPDDSDEEVTRICHSWIERVQLPDPASVGSLHPHELSGGMAQRVAIAVALATEPRLLVADEPTTGLDWSVRREIVDLLVGLCREQGMALVLISHDIQIVDHMAERVLVMYRGELVEDGPRGGFFDPGPGLHPYTRELQERSRALTEGRAGEYTGRPATSSSGAVGGCAYAVRCPVRASRSDLQDPDSGCTARQPEDRFPSPGHRVRCFAADGGEGTA